MEEEAQADDDLSHSVERFLSRYFSGYGDGLPPPAALESRLQYGRLRPLWLALFIHSDIMAEGTGGVAPGARGEPGVARSC